MNIRIPQRYALYVHVMHGNTKRVEPMWAFSAADVQTQFALIRDSTGPMRDLERIEPWREEKHGPWPEELTLKSKPTVVAIIGSSRFKPFHLGAMQRVTLAGKIALSAGFWHHTDPYSITDEQKRQLDELMLHKIDLADEVYVVNVNGYVGESTIVQIKYARSQRKKISSLEPLDPTL